MVGQTIFLIQSTFSSLNILQINVQGFYDKNVVKKKGHLLRKIIKENHIDIVLLQETYLTKRDELQKLPHYEFPIGEFDGFKIHQHHTETAILYREELDITPLPASKHRHAHRRHNIHHTGITVHHDKKDYTIYSYYRPPDDECDPTDIFSIPPVSYTHLRAHET